MSFLILLLVGWAAFSEIVRGSVTQFIFVGHNLNAHYPSVVPTGMGKERKGKGRDEMLKGIKFKHNPYQW